MSIDIREHGGSFGGGASSEIIMGAGSKYFPQIYPEFKAVAGSGTGNNATYAMVDLNPYNKDISANLYDSNSGYYRNYIRKADGVTLVPAISSSSWGFPCRYNGLVFLFSGTTVNVYAETNLTVLLRTFTIPAKVVNSRSLRWISASSFIYVNGNVMVRIDLNTESATTLATFSGYYSGSLPFFDSITNVWGVRTSNTNYEFRTETGVLVSSGVMPVSNSSMGNTYDDKMPFNPDVNRFFYFVLSAGNSITQHELTNRLAVVSSKVISGSFSTGSFYHAIYASKSKKYLLGNGSLNTTEVYDSDETGFITNYNSKISLDNVELSNNAKYVDGVYVGIKGVSVSAVVFKFTKL